MFDKQLKKLRIKKGQDYKAIDEKMALVNLLCEINGMIETGSITVGALGLSEDSANFSRDFYKKMCEEKIMKKVKCINCKCDMKQDIKDIEDDLPPICWDCECEIMGNKS